MSGLERIQRLLRDTAALSTPDSPERRRLLPELVASSGLSEQGIEYAFSYCLELAPTEEQLTQLLTRATPAGVAHVVLSASVFTAPLRAICLALAGSEKVFVRPSRRDPVFTQALKRLSPDSFELCRDLSPAPGQVVFSYGGDDTQAKLRASLPGGVVLRAHGSGIGAAVVRFDPERAEQDAEALAEDMIAFDQRGCLSPRLVVVQGSHSEALRFGTKLDAAVAAWHKRVPLGHLTREERTDIRLFRESMLYAAPLLGGEHGTVFVDSTPERVMIPPVGRLLHVAHASDPARTLEPIANLLTQIATANCDPTLTARLKALVPAARFCSLGKMQKPPLDGPVDLRTTPETL